MCNVPPEYCKAPQPTEAELAAHAVRVQDRARKAAERMASMINTRFGVNLTASDVCDFIVEEWDAVHIDAHLIHKGGKDGI